MQDTRSFVRSFVLMQDTLTIYASSRLLFFCPCFCLRFLAPLFELLLLDEPAPGLLLVSARWA